MGEIVENVVQNADTILSENEAYLRDKRFAKYTILGVNKTVNQQVKRDFTKKTEEKLIKLANSVNADELNYDIMGVLGRWFLNTVIGKFLKQLMDTQRMTCDAYNYFGDTIRKIFDQARTADRRYANKLANSPKSVAQNSVILLKGLNEAFDYYRDNKDYGCSITHSLEEVYKRNGDVVVAKLELDPEVKKFKIENFVQEQSNMNVFNEHSSKVYKELGLDDVSIDTSAIGKAINGYEQEINKAVQLLVDKVNKAADGKRVSIIQKQIKDETASGLISGLIDATGLTGVAKGAFKIHILKLTKETIEKNYRDLFTKIAAGKSDDYAQLENLYNQLKDLEQVILYTYRDIYEFEPDKQVEVNEWIGDVQAEAWPVS
ncbi:MAG: hypothetical protein E7530_03800 [Ruminococcaceae bacterium]|nr:hypothetical protein [Oscillospiraceae bacterium]